MKKVKAEKTGSKVNKGAEQFAWLPYKEATNNFKFAQALANKEGLPYKEVYLVARSDHYGAVKDIWNKEVKASYDVHFEPVKDGLYCIAFDVTGEERPRRKYDPLFDNLFHIKICQITKDKSSVKYLILKPLDGDYLAMKQRTQSRTNGVYEKAHGLAK